MKFEAIVIPSGNATAVEVPPDVLATLGAEARPPVSITINGHTWRSRVAAMRGQRLIGISAAQRAAAGISEGDTITIDVTRDESPRTVEEPADLHAVLNASPAAREAFDRLPFGLRQKHVRTIEEAKSPEVREGRVRRLVETLDGAGQ